MGETEANPTPVQSLDYRTAPPPGASRRRVIVLVVVIIAAVVVLPLLLLVLMFVRSAAITGAVVAPATPIPTVVAAPTPPVQVDYEAQRRTEVYQHYLTYVPATDKVVYEEDPVAAAKLLADQRRQYRPLSGENLDHPWGNSFQRPVLEMSPAGIAGVPPFVENVHPDRCVLFVGKLTSPAGNARLVFLEMSVTVSGARTGNKKGGAGGEPEYAVKIQRKLGYRIYDGAAIAGYPSPLRLGTSLTVKTATDTIPIRWIDGSLRADRSAGSDIRFYAGLLDAQDASHCTIDYEYAGRRRTIDVYLTDDDFLRVLPRGSAVSGGIWEVATAPSVAEQPEKSATQPAP
jgi:hypothetical protein